MKLGCAIGCFTYPHYSAPYEEPLRRVAALEFDGVEMIAAEPEDLLIILRNVYGRLQSRYPRAAWRYRNLSCTHRW